MTSTGDIQPAILRLLWENSGWHSLDEIVSAVGPLVPPGKAFRTNERQRKACRGGGHVHQAPSEREKGTREMAVLFGKRQIIVQTIAGLRKSAWIDLEYTDEDSTKKRKAYKQIKLKDDIEPIFKHEFEPGPERDSAHHRRCAHCGSLRSATIHQP